MLTAIRFRSARCNLYLIFLFVYLIEGGSDDADDDYVRSFSAQDLLDKFVIEKHVAHFGLGRWLTAQHAF